MNKLNDLYAHDKEQIGGSEISESATVLDEIFSPRVKTSFTRTMRGLLRTSTGITADVVTLGVGGDVIVNSLFAVESSISFLSDWKKFMSNLKETSDLFDNFIGIDFSRKIPIYSLLNLDDGLRSFEFNFMKILMTYISLHGTDKLDLIYLHIVKILDRITTVVSDWVACLFPDTAGLAGEITKTILDYIAKNGFKYTYNLISIMSDNMQKMITNTHALKELIHRVIAYLKDFLKHMNLSQVSQIAQSLGSRTINLSKNKYLTKALSKASEITAISFSTINFTSTLSSFLPQTQDILVYAIDKYLIPNIDVSVDLFSQLFPLFLMFTLFIETYTNMKQGREPTLNFYVQPTKVDKIIIK